MGKTKGKNKDFYVNNNTETTFTDIASAHKGHDVRDSPLKGGYDPSYKGPATKRSCTDVICCLIFVIFVAGLAVVAYFAFINGDPQHLIYPQDSDGNLCGVGQYANKKYLFFFDLIVCGKLGPGVFVNGCPTPQICVEKCPDSNYIYLEDLNSPAKLICKDTVDKNTTTKSVTDLVDDGDCAAYYLDSTAIINRCLPLENILNLGKQALQIHNYNVTSEGKTVTGEEMKDSLGVFELFLDAKENGEKIVADVVATWWMILIGLGIAMILSLIWITLMRWIAGFMVWLTIVGFVAVWGFLTGFCWYRYIEVKGTDEEFTFYLVWRLTFSKENVFLAGGIIFGVIFLVVLLIMLFLCERIRIAIALIKEASKAVGSMWSSLLWPVFPFIFQLGVIALWGCIATYLASVGREQTPQDNNITFSNGTLDIETIKEEGTSLLEQIPCNANESAICGFIKYGEGDYTIYLQIYNLFMLFWLVNFVSAVGDLTLAGAFASYYWAFNKPKDIPAFPVMGAFWRCFRYHLGSLAFGSLLIAIVQLIRAFLEYLDAKLKGSENKVAKFILKCLKCCFWCLEKILRFFCRNAYIMIAVYGKNFCASGKRAFELILRNVVRVFVIDKVTDFILVVCKLIVVGLTGIAAYFFFDGRIDFLNDYRKELNFYIVPVIVVVLGAYVIADIFFSVYEMAVDTLFLCFLEDLEKNDGTPEKPYFMDKGLMQILGKKNLKPKKKD